MFLSRNLSFLILLFCATLLHSEEAVYLEHSTAGEGAMPIGIVAFTNRNNMYDSTQNKISSVLHNDLLFTGKFKPFIQNQSDSLFWMRNNIPVFIHGNFRMNEKKQFVVECYLSDVRSAEMLLGKTYTVPKAGLRLAIHRFSDEVMHLFFGEYGIASTKIAYVNKSKGQKNIIVSDYDGANAHQITYGKTLNLMPAWGFQNQFIYFTSFRDGSAGLYSQELATGKVQHLFPNLGQIFAVAVSPKGKWLAFSVQKNNATDIYRGTIDGKKSEKLTFHWAVETSPAYTPGGAEIAFSSDRSGSPQIYIMAEDGSDTRRLSYGARYNESAVFSPQGDRIAFCRMDENQLNIYVMNLDGSQVMQLTQNAGNNEHPSWAPNGKMLSFSSDRSGKSRVYIMRDDGTSVVQISHGAGEQSSPSWSNNPSTQRNTP